MAKKESNTLKEEIYKLTELLVKGQYGQRITLDVQDGTDAKIASNLNKLADLLLINSSLEHSNEHHRIEEFIDVLSSYASGDFKKQLKVTDKNTVIDAIATGINILGEELERTTISRDYYSKEYNSISEMVLVNKKLSEREKEVMVMIADELTNQQIADKLHISKRTVEGHRKNILKKLKLKNTAALIKFVVKNGLV